MKKYKKIAYLLLVITIAILSVAIYANANKKDEESEKNKKFSEVEFLETKLLNLVNEMNNIQTRNYDISANKISSQADNQKNSNESQENDQNSNSQSEDSNKEANSYNSEITSDEQNKSSQKFDLVEKRILTSTEDINWKDVKNEIEILYSSIPTITLDLYQLNTNQQEILNFNKEFDNLTMVVKEENKEKTLNELSKLYDYMPKFMENSTEDQLQKIVVETKASIIRAYSKLDAKNWEEISNDIKEAIDVYSKLLTDTNIDSNKQYSISKIYIMMNELQNAIQIQDESIFLIKYKNIIEEMNTLT